MSNFKEFRNGEELIFSLKAAPRDKGSLRRLWKSVGRLGHSRSVTSSRYILVPGLMTHIRPERKKCSGKEERKWKDGLSLGKV